MTSIAITKYRPFRTIDLPNRRWPTQVIDRARCGAASICADGNHALVEPMGPDRNADVRAVGAARLKEIEVGFPAASETDFGFIRERSSSGWSPMM